MNESLPTSDDAKGSKLADVASSPHHTRTASAAPAGDDEPGTPATRVEKLAAFSVSSSDSTAGDSPPTDGAPAESDAQADGSGVPAPVVAAAMESSNPPPVVHDGPPDPANENERMETIECLKVLDSPEDPVLNSLCNLLCSVLKVPLAGIPAEHISAQLAYLHCLTARECNSHIDQLRCKCRQVSCHSDQRRCKLWA